MWPITGTSGSVARRARIRRASSSTQTGPGCWFMSRSRSSGGGHRSTPGWSQPTHGGAGEAAEVEASLDLDGRLEARRPWADLDDDLSPVLESHSDDKGEVAR